MLDQDDLRDATDIETCIFCGVYASKDTRDEKWAVVLGALAAGCDFFAGYPITPATETREKMGRPLPPRGGVFANGRCTRRCGRSIRCWTGPSEVDDATSRGGISPMQVNVRYASIAQTPSRA